MTVGIGIYKKKVTRRPENEWVRKKYDSVESGGRLRVAKLAKSPPPLLTKPDECNTRGL
jgi:hypothetical protein